MLEYTASHTENILLCSQCPKVLNSQTQNECEITSFRPNSLQLKFNSNNDSLVPLFKLLLWTKGKAFLVNKTNRWPFATRSRMELASQFHPTPGNRRSQLHKMYQSRCTAKNSWWWAERLPETCTVVIPIKLEVSASVGFIHKESVTMHGHTILKKKKVQATPLQSWTGPEGFRRLRLPDFKTIGTWRW